MKAMRSLPAVWLSAMVCLSTACGPDVTEPAPVELPTDTITCTSEARPAVRIFVTDEQGRPLPDAHVTYSFENELPRDIPSERGGRWTTPAGAAGCYVVTVTSPDGQHRVRREVQVQRDECHAITQELTFVLPATVP
jgi:hypothetical protein